MVWGLYTFRALKAAIFINIDPEITTNIYVMKVNFLAFS